MKTTIEYCIGIHQSTGLRITEFRDIITELPDDYECSREDKDRVAQALHAVEVARAEAKSRVNATGASACKMDEWDVENGDTLFDAASEDADTFCCVYNAAAESLRALN
jgi:hypothetical protein